jgi:thermitase
MPPSDDRLAAWSERRQQRLSRIPWLRSTMHGAAQSWYVADELLVVDEHRSLAQAVLADAGHRATGVEDQELPGGVRRYVARGLDVPAAVRAVHARAGNALGDGTAGGGIAGPNHVFMSSPFNHGGPYGPPSPTASVTFVQRPPGSQLVPVTIIDTGLWIDSPLPPVYYQAAPNDCESGTDVDGDGHLDGDVGHANFVAGVIAAHTPAAEIKIFKVLDTFGVCTEDQLMTALGRLDNDVKVINLSLGGFTDNDAPPVGVRAALATALAGHDRVVVAAAGNDNNHTNPFWPAAFTTSGDAWSHQVAAVAAHDGQQLCPWSNTGSWVSLAALGANVTSTFIRHQTFPTGWAQWSGTSFAAPRVAAAIAAESLSDGSPTAAFVRVQKTASSHHYGPYIGLA